MEKGTVINVQEEFSRFNYIIAILEEILIIVCYISLSGVASILQIPLIFLTVVGEYLLSKKEFFHQVKLAVGVRYVELIGSSILLVMCNIPYIKASWYLIWGLLSLEFLCNFEGRDKERLPGLVAWSVVPMLLVELYIYICSRRNGIYFFGEIICLAIIEAIVLRMWIFHISVKDYMEKQYVTQSRFIKDIRAFNHELSMNQEKLSKANEQLEDRGVQLEAANSKIQKINDEILLQNEVLKLITRNNEPEQMVQTIVNSIYSKMKVDVVSLILLPHAIRGRDLDFCVMTNFGSGYRKMMCETIRREGGIPVCFQKKETYVDNHVEQGRYNVIKFAEIKSLLSIPLMRGGELVGALYLADSKYDAFTEDVSFYEATVSTILMGVDNSNLYAKMEDMAIRDELTGIYNRRYLKQICNRYNYECLFQRTPFTVALFDIDQFKKINDSYGHLFGDQALQMVAKVASDIALRNQAVTGRYGGEEFVVAFPHKNLDDTYGIIEQMHRQVKENILVHNGEKVQICLSVGVASFPETCLNPNDLLMHADWAMYYSKQNGRDRISVDSQEIREQVRMK